MKEYPIIFSAPMVRAILEGRKTVTRRIVTVLWRGSRRALPYEPYFVEEDGNLLVDCSEVADSHGNGDYREFSTCMPSPYGRAGDRLWVREKWSAIHVSVDPETGKGDDLWAAKTIPASTEDGWWTPVYAASDNDASMCTELRGFQWHPSIHMPRWASRITLEVVSVRIERLQAITREDAIAEGCGLGVMPLDYANGGKTAREVFAELWDQINVKRATWASNPCCWVISFRRVAT